MRLVRLFVILVFAAALSAQPLPTYQVINAFGQPNNGTGGPAVEATVISPQRVTGDEDGNVYVAFTNRVFKIDAATGVISTIVGTGTAGDTGDGGPALEAQINSPAGIGLEAA
jgi:hypothetical protein